MSWRELRNELDGLIAAIPGKRARMVFAGPFTALFREAVIGPAFTPGCGEDRVIVGCQARSRASSALRALAQRDG